MTRTLSRLCIGMLFLASLSIARAEPPAPAPAPAQPDPELRQRLLKNYRIAFSAIEDMRLEVQSTSQPGHVFHYVRRGNKERGGSPMSFDVSDGQFYLAFYTAVDDATQVGHAWREPANGGLLRRGTEGTGNVEAVFNLFGTSTVGRRPDDVLNSDQLRFGPNGRIDDMEVYEVSAPLDINRIVYDVTFWLAPERSCLPLKMEVRELDGQLRREFHWTEFEQFPNGQWFPRKVVCRHHHPEFVQADGRTITEYTVEATVIERHPDIPDAIFATNPESLPIGTDFQDRVTNKSYMIGAVEPRR